MNDSITHLIMFIISICVVAIIISIPIMLLWNWLMPVIFELPKITILQAYGLVILLSLLKPSFNDNTK
jgi:sensor histidine kinase YesM